MAFKFLLKRLNTYPLNRSDKNNELKIINQIAKENDYHPIKITFNTNTNKTNSELPSRKLEDRKWVVFTYTGKETQYNEVV
jgi:predicted P-loop ATPase